MNPHLARIRIFPVKSLDGQDVSEAVVLRNAGLLHDREYCLLDEDGRILNTKRVGERLVRIRSEVDFVFGEIRLSDGKRAASYHLERDRKKIETWLRRRRSRPVKLARDPDRGFPDDSDASGPTLVATETLREVASWFPGLDVGEVQRRFRANLEIDGVPAFWEDQLYSEPGRAPRPFRIGNVTLEGVNPSARCTVPSRDSRTGEIHEPDFARIFSERRRETLPPWVEESCFDHHYRLAVNTRIPETEAGKVLHCLDEVLLETPERSYVV